MRRTRRPRGGHHAIGRVDIGADTGLEARYLVRIPVVKVGDRELDAAGLADREIAAWIASVEP